MRESVDAYGGRLRATGELRIARISRMEDANGARTATHRGRFALPVRTRAPVQEGRANRPGEPREWDAQRRVLETGYLSPRRKDRQGEALAKPLVAWASRP